MFAACSFFSRPIFSVTLILLQIKMYYNNSIRPSAATLKSLTSRLGCHCQQQLQQASAITEIWSATGRPSVLFVVQMLNKINRFGQAPPVGPVSSGQWADVRGRPSSRTDTAAARGGDR